MFQALQLLSARFQALLLSTASAILLLEEINRVRPIFIPQAAQVTCNLPQQPFMVIIVLASGKMYMVFALTQALVLLKFIYLFFWSGVFFPVFMLPMHG